MIVFANPASDRDDGAPASKRRRPIAKGLNPMTIEQDTTVVAAWEKAVAEYEAAMAAKPGPHCDDDELDAWCEATQAAVVTLLATRAPTPQAIALKARAVLFEAAIYADENIEDPQHLGTLLDADPLEAFAASVFQDALAMGGERPDLAAVQPRGFNARAWLADVEAKTGARLVYNPGAGRMLVFRGGWTRRAEAAIDALTPRERERLFAVIPHV